MKNLIVTIKSWNIENFYKLKKQDKNNDWFLIDNKKDLNEDKVKEINPRYIFVPHWSWIIPGTIWKNYECVVFHSTDLPYGRGGSPIQNLIVKGIYNTKISALKVDEEVDTGSIYLKEDLDLSKGTIEEILKKSSEIIFNEMIPEIISGINPVPQTGQVVSFKRREPEDGNLLNLEQLTERTLYDYVRMLDGEGYPKAYIPLNNGKLEFYDAILNDYEFKCKTKYIKNE